MESKKLEKPRENGTFSTVQGVMKPDEEGRRVFPTEGYIRAHFGDIKKYASVIEDRQDDSCCTMDAVLEDNAYHLKMCQTYGCEYILIEDAYQLPLSLE